MDTVALLNLKLDAVVFLTMSNWKTELRSNRYHYATRFARHFKVIFVQPTLDTPEYYFEDIDIPNIQLLHVYSNYNSPLQTKLISRALNSINIISPLIWIYNPFFYYYIKQANSPLTVYHATETYFSEDYVNRFDKDSFFIQALKSILCQANKIICVSDGVAEGITNNLPELSNKIDVVTNGCDYEFYAGKLLQEIATNKLSEHNRKIVFYQGNIYNKLDFDMLVEVVEHLPDWTFRFCGPVGPTNLQWEKLLKFKNFQYLGVLSPEEVRTEAYGSTVGIIPFTTFSYLKGSFPLKAFEYIACGLPVISSHIDALTPYKDIIDFVSDKDSFIDAIRCSEKKRFDSILLKKRLDAAEKQSYNNKFKIISDKLCDILTLDKTLSSEEAQLKILVLYEPKSLRVSTVVEHLNSFGKYSKHNVRFVPATIDFPINIELSDIDVVIIHCSLRLTFDYGQWTLAPHIIDSLKAYSGLKVLFIQDEYDQTNTAKNSIQQLGIQLIFTCVPESYIRQVYHDEYFNYVDFVTNLTGYVPEKLLDYPSIPIKQRKVDIAYRGRNLPFWYGNLGQEKEYIGIKMKEYCLSNNVSCDIEWTEEKRIYGEG